MPQPLRVASPTTVAVAPSRLRPSLLRPATSQSIRDRWLETVRREPRPAAAGSYGAEDHSYSFPHLLLVAPYLPPLVLLGEDRRILDLLIGSRLVRRRRVHRNGLRHI